MQDEHFMRLALQLAKLGQYQTAPNPMVGAIVVKDGVIAGQGAHLRAGEPHAEVHALRMAGDRAIDSTLYVTLEPCSHHGRTPPCADAIIAAGIKRVVIAIEDKNPVVQGHGIERLRSAGIEVVTGVLAEDAYLLNEMFFTSVTRSRPFVVWKCAATLDGYIATHSGDSQFVTSYQSRETVQELRKTLPAIAVGIGTVLADNPRLTVRNDDVRQPLRVVFDSHLRFPAHAKMLEEPGKTLIYTLESSIEHAEITNKQSNEKLEIVCVPEDSSGRIHLPTALADLVKRGITGVLVEGGSTLVSGLIRERLIDKVVYYVAPKLLGGGVPALQGLGMNFMRDALALRDVSWSMVGSDLKLEAYPDWR